MSPYIDEFLAICTTHLLCVMAPGADFAVVTKNALCRSRLHGIICALGITFGLSVHILYSLLGVAFFVQTHSWIYFIIKFVGVSFLLSIGLSSIKRGKQRQKVSQDYLEIGQEPQYLRSFVEGLFTNLLNPKAALYFIFLFSALIDPKTPSFVLNAYLLTLFAITFIWFTLLSIMVTLPRIKKHLELFLPKIERVMGWALILLAIYILFFD